MALELTARYVPVVSPEARAASRPPGTARRTVLLWAALIVAGLLPLLAFLLATHGSLVGWGGGCLATGGWLLVIALTVQALRARRERRERTLSPAAPTPARDDLVAVARAMVAVAAGSIWDEIALSTDDRGRWLTVRRHGQPDQLVPAWSPALLARVDQFDEAVQRRARPRRRLEVRATSDGVVRATVT